MSRFESLNTRRSTEYRKSSGDEALLRKLNTNLVNLEAELYENTVVEMPPALVFVTGLPRSGTTFTAQLIAEGMEIGRVTNLAARFFDAPLTGMTLSRIVLGAHPKAILGSDYAQTDGAAGLHEFGYFWRNRLRIETLDDLLRTEDSLESEAWRDLKGLLERMAVISGGSLIMKNLYGSYRAESFTSAGMPCIFVQIRRDRRDVFQSILTARRKFFGDARDVWWSLPCDGYRDVMNRSIEEQTAYQVKTLEAKFDLELGKLDRGRVIQWNYDELCDEPIAHLKELRAQVARVLAVDVPLRRDPRLSEVQTRRPSSEARSEAQKFLEAVEDNF